MYYIFYGCTDVPQVCGVQRIVRYDTHNPFGIENDCRIFKTRMHYNVRIKIVRKYLNIYVIDKLIIDC